MLALRHCTVFSVCALAVGCFLDQTPLEEAWSSTSSSTSAANGAAGSKSGFVPRDPGIPTGQGEVTDAGAAEMSGDPNNNAPNDMRDAAVTSQDAGMNASMDAAVVMQMGGAAGAPAAMRDAQVAMDAAPSSVNDAMAAHDAHADAQAQDAATTPADAGPAMLPAPIHRYDFTGMGRTAPDLIGDADARLRGNTRLDGMGAVQFFPINSEEQPASNGVELPDGLLSGLTAFTILGWLDLRSDECWQRLIDFTYVSEPAGDGAGGQTETQVSALYLTPLACPDGIPTVGYVTEQNNYNVESDESLDAPGRVLFGAMYDSTTRTLRVIVEGVVRGEQRVPINMRELGRAAGGLGRSYFEGDQPLNGSIDELRIYAQTFDEVTLAEIARRGPDRL